MRDVLLEIAIDVERLGIVLMLVPNAELYIWWRIFWMKETSLKIMMEPMMKLSMCKMMEIEIAT